MGGQNNGVTLPDDRLPFDLRTLALGLWRRRRTLGLFFLASCILGAVGGFAFGSRIYVAETVLLYKPSEAKAPSLQTQAHMVKIQPHLSEVRQQLRLNCTLEKLGAACGVRIEQNASLLIIRNEWDSAEQAAAIANGLRDVFVISQETIAKAAISDQIHDLEEHLEIARRRLEAADLALREFTANHNMVTLDAEAQEHSNALAAIEQLYEQAKLEKELAEDSGSRLNFPAGGVAQAVPAGSVLPAELDGLAETNTRIQRLRSAVQQDREEHVNRIEMSMLEKELEYTEKLKSRGMVSESEYQRALASYEKQKAQLIDTEQARKWKEELDKLMRARLQFLKEARERFEKKLGSLPEVQRQYAALNREASFWEAQEQDLEEQLARAHRAYDSRSSDFMVVSDARVPPRPAKSSRRPLALVFAVVGSMLGFAVVLALEVLDTTIKSAAEFSLKIPLPLLGVLPLMPPDCPLFPCKTAPELVEVFRMVAQRVRQAVPQSRARILVASARAGEGTTMVAANLAACFGRQGERVLLIDAQGRSTGGQLTSSDLVPGEKGGSSPTGAGLGAYLSSAVGEMREVVYSTQLPGVACIPQLGRPVNPDLVCSNRMRQLLDEAPESYSLVLMDAPPVLSYADAMALARWSDAVVLVVRSRKCRTALVQKAIDNLAPSGTPIVGAVLNGVEPLYMEEDYEDTGHL